MNIPTTEIIYALTAKYELSELWAMDHEGEVNEDIDASITELESLLTSRTEYYIDTIASMKDSIEGSKARIKKIEASIETKEKMIDAMTAKLFSITGSNKSTSEYHSLSWRKSESTVINGSLLEQLKGGYIPLSIADYVKTDVKTTLSPQKAEMKKAIKEGIEIDGVMIETKYNAVII